MIKKDYLKVLSIPLLWIIGGVTPCFSSSYAAENEIQTVQQTRTVKGVVNDEAGPIIGATVMVKGTQNGAVTDMNGEFTLTGVKTGDVIEVSYIGYTTLNQ